MDATLIAQLDQLAQQVADQRTRGGDNILGVLQVSDALAGGLRDLFPEITEHQLGAVLLYLGGRANAIGNRLPDHTKPGVMILANALGLAGQTLYTANPPAVWTCPYTLMGGAACKRVLTAPNEEQLRPRVEGHLNLNHPSARRDRRAATTTTVRAVLTDPTADEDDAPERPLDDQAGGTV